MKVNGTFGYRKEIDGLRALAVIPVIFFHAGFKGFSGGYIGVDIFFVISGYLITSLIIKEIERNDFSLLNFYERRARRILPALSLVLFVTTIFSYILLSPDLLHIYSQSLTAVATFASNIFFSLTNDYFTTVSEQRPLLHTWSLSVEEQFYFLFPVLLTSCWFLGKKWLFRFILLISLVSILYSEVLLSRGAIVSNFFLIFSRVWELLSGALVAFLCLKKAKITLKVREVAGLIGLLLIIYAIVFFNDETPFPGIYTLIPVIASCLIIYFAEADTLIGMALSNNIMVFTGLISYSLYLWHQPLFAFLKIKIVGGPSFQIYSLAITSCFLLAF